MRLVPAAALAAILVLGTFAAGCQSASAPPTPVPPTAAPVDPGPAIDTDALMAAAAAKDGQIVHVTGFVLIGKSAQLCSVVLESYPPQCGGATVALTGTFPADVVAALDKATEPDLAQATWGWVDVVGTFTTTDGPTIKIDRIRVVAP